jgi:hypothetical protein
MQRHGGVEVQLERQSILTRRSALTKLLEIESVTIVVLFLMENTQNHTEKMAIFWIESFCRIQHHIHNFM